MKPFFQNEQCTIYNGDCNNLLSDFEDESIDITVTSPPYSNLRDYSGEYGFDQLLLFNQLFNKTKEGGVLCWNEWDKIENFGYHMTSIQNLMEMINAGFINHERIIWDKMAASYVNQSRYFSSYEYMWVMSKGKPKTINLIKDVEIKHPRNKRDYKLTRHKDGKIRKETKRIMTDSKFRKRDVVWRIAPTNTESRDEKLREHPAKFPVKLPEGGILTWEQGGRHRA